VYFHSWIGSEAWTEGPALLGYNRAVNREKPPAGAVEAELDDPAAFRFHVYRGLQKMLAFRRSEEAFSPDWEQIVLDADGGVFALLRRRTRADGQADGLLCLINLSPKPAEWRLSLEDARRGYAIPEACTRAAPGPWESLWLRFAGGMMTARFSTLESIV
jgi:sucrose phosphorylase